MAAKQHMDNTDVLFGRDNDDLLIGKLGGDTLLAGADDDILIGGPEKGPPPNSDVLVGDTGKDVNIWAPGDGNDAFIGNEDKDTMIFAPFVENADGSLLLTRSYGRKIPHVNIDSQPTFTCTVVPVPESQRWVPSSWCASTSTAPRSSPCARRTSRRSTARAREAGTRQWRGSPGRTRPSSRPSRWTASAGPWAPSWPRRVRQRLTTTPATGERPRHAVVIGASMAGLLAARTLRRPLRPRHPARP